MALLLINLRATMTSPARSLPSGRYARFAPVLLSRGSLPARGVLYSFLAHEIWIFVLLFLSFLPGAARVRHPLEDAEMIDLRQQHEVIYLPRLGGGHEGRAKTKSAAAKSAAVSSEEAARRSKGITYAGPQPMVSDPPNPTNQIQTILQPSLSKPRVLKSFVPLPNMVQAAPMAPPPEIAAARLDAPLSSPAMPQRPAIEWEKRQASRAVLPAMSRPKKARIEDPKLTFPVTDMRPTLLSASGGPKAPRPEISGKLSKPIATRQKKAVQDLPLNMPPSEQRTSLAALSLQTKLPGAETSDSLSRPRQVRRKSPSFANGKDARDLLTLSPAPLPPAQSLAIPLGEARGRFAISPAPPPPALEKGPGAGGSDTSSAGVGRESASGPVPVNAAGGNGGRGKGTGGNGASPGLSAGNGRANGAGSGGSGRGAGHGAGDGHGGGSFSGMTIQGGTLEGGGGAQSGAQIAAPQTSYSMTIVSTASSGGGLGDYGVFTNEQVYTVYLDVRKTLQSKTPSWTLQCAVLRAPDAITIVGQEPGAGRTGFVPPIPITKELPELPADRVQDHLGELTVISGVLDTGGKLQKLTVKRSPDGELARKLIFALDRWVFRPAEMDGRAVPVKILLGIPVSPSE